MRYLNRENKQTKININLDYKNYKLFLDKFKTLGQQLEYKSNKNKLDYAIVVIGIREPYMNCVGWASRCEDTMHVLFTDWDKILFWILELQVKYLIKKYNLPPFYIFKTYENKDNNGKLYGNYLAICLGKYNFLDITKMQDELSCDEAHKKLPLIYRFHSWVLRLSPKGKRGRPEFKCIIGNINKIYNQKISSAHLNVLKKLYPNIPNIRYNNKDNLKGLWKAPYKTASG